MRIIDGVFNYVKMSADIISSLYWFRKGEEHSEPPVIDQFVHSVDEFSSQYGSDISVSYTAFNLRGPPSNFPDYGDYPQAYVMRTYGKWWEEAPSAQIEYMPQNSRSVASQDFIEVSFEKDVYPLEVSLFETYNPGALVRIWAFSESKWYLLWEGEPGYAGDRPRIFTPTIRQIGVLTRTLRLEFNHSLLPYYTELDAVLLKGREKDERVKKNFTYYCSFNEKTAGKGKILDKIIASKLHQAVGSISLLDDNDANKTELGDFEKLPNEAILCIFKYLDIQSLCRCVQVNKHMQRLASDCVLYRSMDFRPYWHCLQSQVLSTFSMRCKNVQKLDLSWCGGHDMVSPQAVINFLLEFGSTMTHLRMNCCHFVNNAVLKCIVRSCPNLQELCLRSVLGCTEWKCLSFLKNLKRLDFYRTEITGAAVAAIVRANPGLLHLNVGSCKMISSMDEVAIALGNNCPGLISVDFWKSYSLTPQGIKALGNCKHLQELDVGWCLQIGSSGEWLQSLHGEELRKLFLGALRGISDRDIRALLPRLTRLVQLDLLGVRSVSPDIIESILFKCHELRLLDLSFCDQIYEYEVSIWRSIYPHVTIQRSFQSPNMNSGPDQFFFPPNYD